MNPFSTNAVDLAKRQGLALITGVQMIDALRSLQLGDFDPSDWWESIVNTSGVHRG